VRAKHCITFPDRYWRDKTLSVIYVVLFVVMSFLFLISNVSAENPVGEFKPLPVGNQEGSKAELSVLLSDSTFAFGTNALDTWLTPQTSVITNDGTAAEDFLGRISQLTDGFNTWEISPSVNGADSVRVQWSTTSESGPWTDISAYDIDFTIVTNVAVDDSIKFWFRIQTPANTSSYNEHSSTLTVTAHEY
jgi:hypothetical protein